MALRLAIGWHFFQEGSTKLQEKSFSSEGFLSNAKGPLSGFYRSVLKDPDGLERLNYNPHAEGPDKIELRQTLGVWEQYRERVISYYGFDDKQKRDARRIFDGKKEQLTHFFDVHRGDINEYFLELERIDEYAKDPSRTQVPTLYAQTTELAGKQRGKRAGWLKQIDQLWIQYGNELNSKSNDEQRSRVSGPLALSLPGGVGSWQSSVAVNPQDGSQRILMQPRLKLVDTDIVNQIIPYFDLTVGVLLVLGLFTRTAATLGGLFLLSVVLSQWPWAAGAAPAYYQTIEMMGMFVLAAVGAGRIAGLDFFISQGCRRCCGRSRSTTEA